MSHPELATPDRAEAPDDWVPVERRWFGLDRATIAPSLVVLALALVMAFVIPAIDEATPYDDKVVAGDQIGLSDGFRFTPPVGWSITDGVRIGDAPSSGRYPGTATVVSGPFRFTVKVGPYDGSPRALLARIRKSTNALSGNGGLHVTSTAQSFRTSSGDIGALARFRGTGSDGLIAALVVDGVGVEMILTGPADADDVPTDEIAAMLASITDSAKEPTS